MRAPYGIEIIESCQTCHQRTGRIFCDLPTAALEDLDAIKYSTVFPKGAMLFVEGQPARGVFVLCSGRVKLSTSSSDGRTIIMHIATPGEVLGLSATISGTPYEVTAETLEACQLNFIRAEDFTRLLERHGEACMRAARHLSQTYHDAYDQVRALGLSHSAGEKLALLLLDWCDRDGQTTDEGIRLRVTLTHEEIAQVIGSSRETVTRLLSDLKSREILRVKGSTWVVRDRAALAALVQG